MERPLGNALALVVPIEWSEQCGLAVTQAMSTGAGVSRACIAALTIGAPG